MRPKIISFFTLLLLLITYASFSQPIDNSRLVVVESVSVGGKPFLLTNNKVVASENDSIVVNFKLKAPNDAPKTAFLFQTTFKNGVDSAIKTLGVTQVIFKNLKDDIYFLRISAFDLQRKWAAVPVEIKIEVDNEKSLLYRQKDSLSNQVNSMLGLISKPSVDKNKFKSGSDFSLLNIILSSLLVIFIVGFIFLLVKLNKLNKTVENSSGKSAKIDYSMIKNVVSKSDYEILQVENSRLRAEIASLRGQIDAMAARSQQLAMQNKDLQISMTKLSSHKNELEELQQQKDDLFAVIIHDIKNPAALIKSLVELLTSYDLSATEQQEIINDIANTTGKIVALSQEVSRILALESNKLTLNFESCDINQVAQDVFHRNHIAAKNKSITMMSEYDKSLPDVEIDPQRIDEVIDNLISNAIKFTSNNGTVKIKTYKENDDVVVEVSDNGLGLTEDDLKYAFQRGARLSAKPTQGESSTGLGLWIVKKLLDAHNGKVWVRSTTGKGSTFSFSIPIKKSAQ
ncbi:hypothetical protein MASR1M45_20610 [Candidatus Kapaibacterium sp.]